MHSTKKIFIFCSTGLGNIVLFLPAYHLLKSRFPNSEITVALDSRWYNDPFFKFQFGEGVIFHQFPQKKEGLIPILKEIFTLRKNRFDLVLMPYSGPSKKLGLFLLLLGSKNTIFFETGSRLLDSWFNPCLKRNNDMHYLEKNLMQIDPNLDYTMLIEKPWILSSKNSLSKIKTKLKPENYTLIIGMHTGGNLEFNSSRVWPHYDRLLDLMLAKKNVKVILFGHGLEEKKIISALIKNKANNCTIVINNSLIDVCSYLSLCDVFVGNDSGIMNLSVGIGTPTVGILGPTDPRHTGPYGEEHTVARSDLPCSPCFNRGTSSTDCYHCECLTKLKPEYVWQLVKQTTDKRS
ncbi:MAG: glycosyltransferase family 9 protein [Desulfobacteraceae bacterium]|nr:glycosyltransferase family 9 protein [Desulfobacteraceae bacterium]